MYFPDICVTHPALLVALGIERTKVLMARKGYVFLFEKVIASADANISSKKPVSPLTPAEQRRLDELEEDLPLQTIIMFRTMARKEVCVRGIGAKCLCLAGFCRCCFDHHY